MPARDASSLGAVRTLSAFLPSFNEAGNVERVVGALVKELEQLGLDEFEVIVVDDGSRDGTGAIADSIAERDPRVRVVHHPANVGYGGALRSGFGAARMEWVFLTDGDGQFDVSEITRLTELSPEHDLVVGFRAHRQDNIVRKLNMHLWTALVNATFRLRVRDVDCAFKLVRRERIAAIGPLESDGAFASTEMLAKLRKLGVIPREVAVSHLPRQWGSPTGANPRVIARAFRDLGRLRRRLTTWSPT